MKDILKRGKVRVWAIGGMYAIETTDSATEDELRDAVIAEEELDLYRQNAEMN